MAKKKTTEERVRNAVKAFVESEEAQQTPEEKRENAWFPIHIKSVMENKDNICYENGVKTGESLINTFGFDTSDAWAFVKGLRLFWAGVTNAIEKLEKEIASKVDERPKDDV